jgi:cell division protease FtsH
MSEKLGPRVFGHDHTHPFLGREFSSEPDYSDEIASEIDAELRRLVEQAHVTARRVLEEHRQQLDEISRILVRQETIDADQFLDLLGGKPEEEVFKAPEPEPETPEGRPLPERPVPGRGSRPMPLPRPGLAGGGAE